MLLILLAFLGGVLTIASPCILPVLPFVFARADQPFLKRGLPMLAGMAATFAVVATLAAVGGGWAARANLFGRYAAMALLALFGLTLLVPSFAEKLTAPLVRLGGRLSEKADSEGAAGGVAASLLLGVATGLLWAPCAGPILGIILTGAALHGANVGTTVLLFAYALGAATSLALALLVGGKVFAAMKRSLGAGEWIRRGLGAAVIAAVVAIGFGADTGLLAQLSLANTASLEQGLIDRLHMQTVHAAPQAGDGDSAMMRAAEAADTPRAQPAVEEKLPILGEMPSLAGATAWLNSPPLDRAALKGKVVLVDFWTYSCINCLRTLPYVRAWADKYRKEGLVVIGVHAPEFAFEKSLANVKAAVRKLKIDYPVALDNNYAIWGAFHNQYWPAEYFIDAKGHIRHVHFGEGNYAENERVIQALLAENGQTRAEGNVVEVTGAGVEAAPDMKAVKSPETYIGYARAENFVSPGGAARDKSHSYTVGALKLNQWGLSGDWTVGEEKAVLDQAGGCVTFKFHARDLNLVLGPAADGKPVRFRVTVDGAAPGADHGVDTNAQGFGAVTGDRLYQLVRQHGAIADRQFTIRFLDPGVRAYSFTFG